MTESFSSTSLFENIDLNNINYDDILLLYKGWKRSEVLLRDKTNELRELKAKIKQLNDSHYQFRSKINALESVKELTISLQSQVNILKDNNDKLMKDNKELADLNFKAEEYLREHLENEKKLSDEHNLLKKEHIRLTEKYESLLVSKKSSDILASDEQLQRLNFEKKLQISNETIEKLQKHNFDLSNQLEQKQLQTQNHFVELQNATEQLVILSSELNRIRVSNEKMTTYESEIGMVRGDIARLIHLMEAYPPPIHSFVEHWNDSEGMAFVGKGISHPSIDELLNQFKDYEGFHDNEFSTVNLSLEEFENLQRVYGNDPFPLSENMQNEEQYWVPKRAAEIGMEFLSSHLPHAPPIVIMEFLRKMNKVWLNRERRKIQRLNELHEKEIKEMKRRVNNSKPYRGVIFETKLRHLESQIKEDRRKEMVGFPKSPYDDLKKGFESRDFYDDEVNATIPPHHQRACMVSKHQNKSISTSEVANESTKKLLEASLISLETLGRRVVKESYSANAEIPTENYVQGAIWISRNMCNIFDHLVETMESIRLKKLNEIEIAARDTNTKRSCYRLNLLASSIISEMLSCCQNAKHRAIEVTKKIQNIHQSDPETFQKLVKSLPLHSAIKAKNNRHFKKSKESNENK